MIQVLDLVLATAFAGLIISFAYKTDTACVPKLQRL